MISYVSGNHGLPISKEWSSGCWINVECPTESEMEYLLKELQVPEEFISDIEDFDERPRIEVEDNWQLIIMRIPMRNVESLPYVTVPLGVILKGDLIITLCYHKTDILDGHIFFNRRKGIGFSDKYDLVLKLMLSSCVWYLKYLKQLNIAIKESESELSRSIKNKELYNLLQFEKCYVYFITALKGNDILLHRIKGSRNYRDSLDPELIEDVEIELKQALETANTHSDILSGMMDAYASVISNNMNMVMKELTLISIVLMIPTLIASFFGMNLTTGLENSSVAFIAVIICSVMISAFGVMWFRYRKWF